MRYRQGYRHIEETGGESGRYQKEKLASSVKASPAQEIQDLRDLLDPYGGILLFP
jgi:hypothetical protein